MKLSQLLKGIIEVAQAWEREITHLTIDSWAVKPGSLFFAYPGLSHDGRDYITAAIAAGATAIICEKGIDYENFSVQKNAQGAEIPIFPHEDLKSYIGNIAAEFFDKPAKKLKILGVTGTNGKTSCTHFLARCLQKLGRRCAIIGTLGYGFPDKMQPINHTTPDAIAIQALLAQLYQQGAEMIAMEVSSHALDQGRVHGIEFELAMFTNLSRDHLDYHHDMASYARAKRRLFDMPVHHIVINAEDDYGLRWIDSLQQHPGLVAYALQVPSGVANHVTTVYANSINISKLTMTMIINSPWGSGLLKTKLLGRFNLHNLLAVLASLCSLDIAFDSALELVSSMETVSGRMEPFIAANKPLVVVDYAHTPDALSQALTTLREYCQGELWCVFGCGGDRDQGKRAMMGQIANQCADKIVLTDDNPRHEDPEKIIKDICEGLYEVEKTTVIHARADAIDYAIAKAQLEDIILIAGKGHETYQQRGDEKILFSDRQHVAKTLGI